MAAFVALPEVKALVPDATFKRAKELVSSNKFRDVRFEGPLFEQCVASCSGSNEGDIYSLSVVIKASSSKPLCNCSCPAAAQPKVNFCKHVVALLLLRIKEHLQMANIDENQECRNSLIDASPTTASVAKKGSIFSAEGWNEVAKTRFDGKKLPLSKEGFGEPVLAIVSPTIINEDEILKHDKQSKDDNLATIASSIPKGNDEIGERMEPAVNVVDDMLGLLFGPSLSTVVTSKPKFTEALTEDLRRATDHTTPKMDLAMCDDSTRRATLCEAATTRSENTQAMDEGLIRNATCHESSTSDIILLMTSDSAPKPKKKGSLKDKVKMLLG